MTMDEWVKALKAKWSILLQASTWIMVLLAGFVLQPPVWDFEQNLVWYRFAHFLVAALVGLAFIPVSRWASKIHTWSWFLVSIVLLITGATAFVGYQVLRENWTVKYANRPVIVGSLYSPDAIAYKNSIREEEKREVSDQELVMAAAGKREDLWDIQEIRNRGRILAGVYLLTITFFALAIVSIIQTIYCNAQTAVPAHSAGSSSRNKKTAVKK